MYSEKLEGLIDAILADGEITDKEMAILRKRAEAEGEDPDEVEIVVEGRLAKMQKKVPHVPVPPAPVPPAPIAPQPQNKSNKFGEIRKCPNCGGVVEAATVKCNECGYVFVGVEAVSSVVKFSEMLERIQRENPGGLLSGIGALYGLDSGTRRMTTAIENFPIPNTKEDLMEFLLYLKPKTKKTSASSATLHLINAYKNKYKECVKKAKLYFSDDPQIMQILEEDKGLFGRMFGKR